MKALFLLLDGKSNASSYHRVIQFLPTLAAQGIEARIAAPPLYGRVFDTGQQVSGAPKAAFYGAFLAVRTFDVLSAGRFDVVVIQRDLFPFGPPFLERLLRKRARRTVYDTDDATYLRPAFTPNNFFQKLRRFDKVAEVVRHSRWVSVATEPIATWARRHNPNVSVVPMAVDLAQYVVRPEPARLALGWAGTAGGLRYVRALQPVLEELDTPVKVVSGGYRDLNMPGVNVEAEPWRGIEQISQMSIGLLPLDDTEFERAKFPFKLLQYMALGIPVVASRVGLAAEVIVDGENGLLAQSHDEWVVKLQSLIRDRELRQRLGSAGRATVEASYTIERVGPLLAAGLLDAAR